MGYRRQTGHVLVALAALGALSAGCGTGGQGHSGQSPAELLPFNSEQFAPANLEELAARAGCEDLEVQVNAESIRSGYCHSGQDQFVLTTFTTQKGQQEWTDQALGSGQVLIGNGWAAGAEAEMLQQLRDKLGGSLQGGGHH
ncbi:hypothetical protein GCM10012275_35420 [Longimycelium tulufanense]|uniref:Lipoprotein n=1 Tax=Longimycelium tulufanense TaxID=907463 RepID=A0A8J3C9Q4_9PSEU|nr:hypothetical protein [Longimycelium tulufanense]GGM61314.1 hypothetical protein GCM10012275_35420 [Longimycelium tulufanense]